MLCSRIPFYMFGWVLNIACFLFYISFGSATFYLFLFSVKFILSLCVSVSAVTSFVKTMILTVIEIV